jgi:hypothetical protein
MPARVEDSMSTEAPVVMELPRPKRPIGVWGMTVIDLVFAGIFLLAACFRSFNYHLGYPARAVVVWGVLGFAICFTAQLAWYGSRYGRAALLALMTIYLGFALAQNANYLLWAMQEHVNNADFVRHQIFEALRSVVWLAANFWFLTGRRTRGFYA